MRALLVVRGDVTVAITDVCLPFQIWRQFEIQLFMSRISAIVSREVFDDASLSLTHEASDFLLAQYGVTTPTKKRRVEPGRFILSGRYMIPPWLADNVFQGINRGI